MTLDEPEIVLGGDDPVPSAPPLSFNDGPPATATALPTAIGTPLSAVAPATVTSTGATIEKSANTDGSLAVKLTTTTPQPNGYREVRIEHFLVPANMAASAEMALDAGEPPSALYMTKMEQQVLPPGTGQVISHPPQTPTTAYPTSDTHAPNYPLTNAGLDGMSSGRSIALGCGAVCCIFVVLAIVGAIGAEESNTNHSSPSFPSYPTPSYPSYPSYPTPSYPSYPSWPSTPSFPSRPSWGYGSLTQRPHPAGETANPTWWGRQFGITRYPSYSRDGVASPTPPPAAVAPPPSSDAAVAPSPSSNATVAPPPSPPPATVAPSPSATRDSLDGDGISEGGDAAKGDRGEPGSGDGVVAKGNSELENGDGEPGDGDGVVAKGNGELGNGDDSDGERGRGIVPSRTRADDVKEK